MIVIGWSLAMGYIRVKEGCRRQGGTRKGRKLVKRGSKSSSQATEATELCELPPPDLV